jgi:ATP-dependent DNA helicase RecG
MKTLVAFANTAGGVLLIGVEDQTRHVVGVSGALATEERLTNLVADTIRPRLVPDFEVVPWRKTQVLVVHVYPSSTRPHYLARLGPEEGVFLRVGSTNRRADAPQIEEMRRFSQLGSFDEQPIPELSSEVLDFRAASELFAPIHRLRSSAFQTLKVTAKHQGRDVPQLAGTSSLRGTGLIVSQTPGFRPVASQARADPVSWTVRKSALICRGLLSKRSGSSKSMSCGRR